MGGAQVSAMANSNHNHGSSSGTVARSQAFRWSLLLLTLALLFLFLLAGTALAGVGISRVSMKGDGTQSNNSSGAPTLSADGLYVCFSSLAYLTTDDTNSGSDVYRLSRGGQLSLMSKNYQGGAANASCSAPYMSADASAIVFYSAASDLVQGVGNGKMQVYLRVNATNYLVSHSTAGNTTPCASGASPLGISAGGGYVLFQSNSSDLVAGDTNGLTDIFVYDASSAAITRVNVASDGTQANSSSGVGYHLGRRQ
jgi:hypothetical protein